MREYRPRKNPKKKHENRSIHSYPFLLQKNNVSSIDIKSRPPLNIARQKRANGRVGWEKGWFEARLGKSERDSRFYFFLFFSLNYFTVARACVLFLLFSQTTEEKRGEKEQKKGKERFANI